MATGVLADSTIRAWIVFTEGEPILVLTSKSAINEPGLLEILRRRGIAEFIAYEIPVDEVRRHYGLPFEVIVPDLERSNCLRVLDFDGSRILDTFSLTALGPPIHHAR